MAIVAWGTYVPESRLDRGLIGAALGTPAGAGTRSVAGYDEDTTSMGVEAARNALANLPGDLMPQRVLFATANPAYLDKTNAIGDPRRARAAVVGGRDRRRRRRAVRHRGDDAGDRRPPYRRSSW